MCREGEIIKFPETFASGEIIVNNLNYYCAMV